MVVSTTRGGISSSSGAAVADEVVVDGVLVGIVVDDAVTALWVVDENNVVAVVDGWPEVEGVVRVDSSGTFVVDGAELVGVVGVVGVVVEIVVVEEGCFTVVGVVVMVDGGLPVVEVSRVVVGQCW